MKRRARVARGGYQKSLSEKKSGSARGSISGRKIVLQRPSVKVIFVSKKKTHSQNVSKRVDKDKKTFKSPADLHKSA